MKARSESVFFVLSTGRSGTQTVAQTLSQLPGCLCLHEPDPTLIEESSGYHYGEVDAEEIRRILRETRAPKVGDVVYGESNQMLSLLVPELVRVFPNGKFVWLIRNGLDFVASAMGRGWFPTQPNDWHALGERRRYWVAHRVQGDLSGDIAKELWDVMTRFDRCCWYWSYVNRIIERDLRQYAPSAYCTVKLEQINTELLRVARWLGFSPLVLPPVKKHNVAIDDVYTWQCWTASERRRFLHWCGEQMDIFYPGWRDQRGKWLGVPYGGASIAQRTLGVVPYLGVALNRLSEVALRRGRMGRVFAHWRHVR